MLEYRNRQLTQSLKEAKQNGEQSHKKLQKQLEDNRREKETLKRQQDQYQQKEAVLEELSAAIQPIMDAISSDKTTVTSHKWQSLVLLISAVACFATSMYLIISRNTIDEYINDTYQLLMQISPSFILVFLGAALLRHDWKIRQLTLKLIDQNNSVDIAMGMLKTALRLSNIGEREKIEEIPDLVKESFAEARRALLYRNRSDASKAADDNSKDADLLQQIRGLALKSSAQTKE